VTSADDAEMKTNHVTYRRPVTWPPQNTWLQVTLLQSGLLFEGGTEKYFLSEGVTVAVWANFQPWKNIIR